MRLSATRIRITGYDTNSQERPPSPYGSFVFLPDGRQVFMNDGRAVVKPN
jgi:hypothetical protein